MSKLVEFIKKYRHFSFKERTNFNSRISMIGNFFIACCKLILGIVTLSLFYCISAFYSVGVGLAKQVYFQGLNASNNELSGENNNNFENQKIENKYYKLMAFILLFTSIIYAIYMARLLFTSSDFEYGLIPAIGIAAISFTELGVAIKGLIKSNKRKDLLLSGLKSISLASACTAIVLTQVALLSTVEGDYSFYNALFGIGVGIFCILISIYMFIKLKIKAKKG